MTQTFLSISTSSSQPPVLAGGTCSECGQQTVCAVCGSCHYCSDIDLPCATSVRRRINQAMTAIEDRRRAAALSNVTVGCNDIVEPLGCPMWEEAISPLFSCNPDYQTASRPTPTLAPFLIVARSCGNLVLTTWGALYEWPYGPAFLEDAVAGGGRIYRSPHNPEDDNGQLPAVPSTPRTPRTPATGATIELKEVALCL